MPKVIFICPAIGRFKGERGYIRSWQMKPLSLGVLSALTPDNWQQQLIDDRLEEIDYQQTADLIAITVETYAARRAYQIADEFRSRGQKVIMGGYHATLCSEEVLKHADAICIGRAEDVWPKIIDDVQSGHLQPIYRQPDNSRGTWITPNHDLFKNKDYVKLDMVESSRGCPHRCKFCSITSFYKSSFDRRDPSDVVDEIDNLGAKTVFFVDDNFAGDRSGTLALLKAIKPLKIRWITQVSVHVGNDSTLLDAMASAGCLGVLIGFESTDKDAIKSMGKTVNHKVDYGQVVSEFTQRQIGVYGTFLFGYDGDNDSRRQNEVDFAINNCLSMAAFNHIVPFPGTPLYSDLQASNRLLSDRWWLDNNYRFGMLAYQPQSGTPRSVERACQTARQEFYSPKNIYRRSKHIPWFIDRLSNKATYWAVNLMMRREQTRFGWPIGEVSRNNNNSASKHTRFATDIEQQSDKLDAELRELMSECSMAGSIEKTALAENSAFAALSVLGRNPRVCTLRDTTKFNRLIGMGVLVEKQLWVNGHIKTFGYLTLLRISPEYRALGLTAFGYRTFRKRVSNETPSVCLTAIFDDNVKAMRALTGNRGGVPKYSPVTSLQSFVTGPRQASRLNNYNGEFNLQHCTSKDLDELLDFWNSQAQNSNMMPAYHSSDFTTGGLLDGLNMQDIVIAKRNGNIVACCGLWDQRHLRQLRIDSYNGLLRYTKPVANMLLRIAGLPTLPQAGEIMNLKNIAMVAFTDIHAFEATLKLTLNDIKTRSTIIAFTAPTDSNTWPVFNKLRGIHQGSTLYTVALSDNSEQEILNDNIYVEGGSL